MIAEPLIQWVIYSSPKDHPGKTLARRFEITTVVTPTTDIIFAELPALRERLASLGLVNIGRYPMDHESVVEVWT